MYIGTYYVVMNSRGNLGKTRTRGKMGHCHIMENIEFWKNFFLQKNCSVGHTLIILFDINKKMKWYDAIACYI